MKSRPRIKFLQLPHSVAQRIESLTNRTAAALLSFLCRKTIGFGQGVVEFSYQQLAQNLKVGTRAIARAAKLLESAGDILRDRPAGGVYRWRILLDKNEVIADPNRTYSTRSTQPQKSGGVMIARSTPSCPSDHDPHDRSIMTPVQDIEQENSGLNGAEAARTEQLEEPLKILIKDKDLKKQHLPDDSTWCTGGAPQVRQECAKGAPAVHQPEPTNDDEPLHKICLRGLREHGVSQRVARKLCNLHSPELILSVLKTAPQRPGIQNLAAYIVSEIQDGGYGQTTAQPSSVEQKKAHRDSGGPSNYAHLTGHKIPNARHRSVKTEVDAPIAYRSVEETRAERELLELQKQQQEQIYREEGKRLLERFKNLSEDLQLNLKLVASVELSRMVPMSGNREQVLRDKTFQKLANRNVLERFFEALDRGLDEHQALNQFDYQAVAA